VGAEPTRTESRRPGALATHGRREWRRIASFDFRFEWLLCRVHPYDESDAKVLQSRLGDPLSIVGSPLVAWANLLTRTDSQTTFHQCLSAWLGSEDVAAGCGYYFILGSLDAQRSRKGRPDGQNL
jgi:hypothetical protein